MLSETDDTSSIVYTYDDAGLVTSVTESNVLCPTVVYAYAYDSDDLLASVTVTIGGVADYVDAYAYDSDGNLVEISRQGVSGGNAVAAVDLEIAYNDDGQVATIARYLDGVLTVTATYSYDSDGLLVGLVYSQGETILASYTFSGIAWDIVEAVEVASPDGQSMLPTSDTSEVSDALLSGSTGVTSLLTSVTSADGTVTYTYDVTGQLLSATYTDDSLSDETYTYDSNGNRTSATTGSSSSSGGTAGSSGDTAGLSSSVYTTGTDNQLLSDGTYRYAYDAEGNRTAKFVDANADGVLDSGDTDITIYTWDARNRLVEVSDYSDYAALQASTPEQVVDYLYDVENRWIGELIDSNGDGVIDHETGFVYDGNQIVLQFDKDVSESATALPVPWIWPTYLIVTSG